MLKLLSTEPEWLDLLPGVRAQFAPIGPKAFRAARAECLKVLARDDDKPDAEPDNEEASDALARVLIRRGLLAWEGIANADGSIADPADPVALDRFVAHPLLFLAAQDRYVMPFLLRDAEGNASAGSPDGTGAAETPADDTAPMPAKRKRKGAAKAART